LSAEPSTRRSDRLLAGGALVMILCCAVGPAVIGAAAGSAIGGWLGIVCAVVLAAGAGLVIHRRRGRKSC
jgi:hypothetical protein